MGVTCSTASSVCCAALLSALAAAAAASASASAAAPPNVVVLFADDLGYGDIGPFGAPTIRTPHLDRMAAEGMRFTTFYSGSSICSPSRSSLMTGRLPIRNGVYQQDGWPTDMIFRVFFPFSTGGLPAEETTIAEMLSRRGYRTALIGKWHLGHWNNSLPTQNGGFDEFFGLPYSQDEGCPPGWGNNCSEWQAVWPGVPLYRNATIVQQPVNLDHGKDTLMSRYNAEALRFVDACAASDTPFLLIMAYDEVHVPLFASSPFRNTSRRGLFGDAVEEMDDSIGQILQRLRDLRIAENTLVIFTSDNGPWLMQQTDGGSAAMFREGKGSTWEGGFRMPAIAWWPGTVAPLSVNMDMASTLDIFTTACELAGVPPLPADHVIDGVSLVAALKGTGPVPRDAFFFYRDSDIYAARVGAFKAHFFTRSGFGYDPPITHDPPLLFNLQHDPGEHWALDPATPEAKRALAAIEAAVAKHRAHLTKGPPQLMKENSFVAPCCDRHSTPKCTCGPW